MSEQPRRLAVRSSWLLSAANGVVCPRPAVKNVEGSGTSIPAGSAFDTLNRARAIPSRSSAPIFDGLPPLTRGALRMKAALLRQAAVSVDANAVLYVAAV